MAARNDAFVKPCFELLRKKSSYPLISEGRRICQLNLLTLGPRTGVIFSWLACLQVAVKHIFQLDGSHLLLIAVNTALCQMLQLGVQ